MDCQSGLTAGDDQSNGVPDAKIPGNLRWDHCLGPCTAFNVMNGQAGEAHAAHQNGNFVARQSDFSASRILNVLDSIVQCIVDGSANGYQSKYGFNGKNGTAYFSSSSGGGTMSSTPLMVISPCELTRVPRRVMRSVMGSCTVRPKIPECRSRAGPATVTL